MLESAWNWPSLKERFEVNVGDLLECREKICSLESQLRVERDTAELQRAEFLFQKSQLEREITALKQNERQLQEHLSADSRSYDVHVQLEDQTEFFHSESDETRKSKSHGSRSRLAAKLRFAQKINDVTLAAMSKVLDAYSSASGIPRPSLRPLVFLSLSALRLRKFRRDKSANAEFSLDCFRIPESSPPSKLAEIEEKLAYQSKGRHSEQERQRYRELRDRLKQIVHENEILSARSENYKRKYESARCELSGTRGLLKQRLSDMLALERQVQRQMAVEARTLSSMEVMAAENWYLWERSQGGQGTIVSQSINKRFL
jgi:hypothetical protein